MAKDGYRDLIGRLFAKAKKIRDKELKELLIEAAASLELLRDAPVQLRGRRRKT